MIDDGSTDHSGMIADSYALKYPYMQVFHRPNQGVAAARNAGIRQAEGEWIYFCDPDDWLAEDGIARLFLAVRKHPRADVILLDGYQNTSVRETVWEHFARASVWEGKRNLYKLQRGILYYPMEFPSAKASLAAPWDKIYRKDFLVRRGLAFREELKVLDDMVFNMEVFGEAGQVAYEKHRVYHYRYVASSITNAYRKDRVEQDRKVWEFLRRYQDLKRKDGIWKEKEAEAFEQAYYCRVIRSFAICCRLNFYHKDNGKTKEEKHRYVRRVLADGIYREAFGKVRMSNLEWRLKVVTALVRCGLYGGLYFLSFAQGRLSAR